MHRTTKEAEHVELTQHLCITLFCEEAVGIYSIEGNQLVSKQWYLESSTSATKKTSKDIIADAP